MINNYLSKEYIGVGCLTELEHGKAGLNQYKNLISQNNRKKWKVYYNIISDWYFIYQIFKNWKSCRYLHHSLQKLTIKSLET